MTEAVPMIRSSELRALHAFWRDRAAGRPMPGRADFDVFDLKPWLPHLMLLDVIGEAEFRYRVYGTALSHMFGHDHTGRTTGALHHAVQAMVVPDYAEACRVARPTVIVAPRLVYISALDVERQKSEIEKLILPIGAEGQATQLLVGVYPL